MSFNEGRNIYLHEILVDYLKNTEEYSDENIQKKLVRFSPKAPKPSPLVCQCQKLNK